MARTEGSAPACRDGCLFAMDQERVLSLESRFSAACVGLMEPRATCCSWVKVSARSAVVPCCSGRNQVHVAGLDVQVVGVLEVVVTVALKPLTDGIRPSCFWYSLRPSSEVRKVKNFSAALSCLGDLVVDAEGRIDGARRVRGVTLLQHRDLAETVVEAGLIEAVDVPRAGRIDRKTSGGEFRLDLVAAGRTRRSSSGSA